ncbi:MAG: hypothetical protein V3U78_09965 [Thiotrichaceae bacterium]
MSWDDIDFDLIVKGMITRGPAQVSFGEYMQTFSRALDERWNMVTTDLVNFPVPEIPFETNEIRADIFNLKFRDLIKGYRDLWFGFNAGRDGFSYYSEVVLTDPTNSADYLFTDQELEDSMGEEAWDIFSDFATIDTRPLSEIWKASIFQAMFIVYEFTNVIGKGSTTDTVANQNRPTIIDGSGDYYEAARVPFSSGRNYVDTLAALNWVQMASPRNTIAFFGFDARGGDTPENWAIRPFNSSPFGVDPLINKTGLDVILQSKDLAGNILSMNYNSSSSLRSNQVDDFVSTFTPTSSNRKYNGDFDKLSFSGGFNNPIEIETPIDNVSQTPDGTKQEYKVSGGSPLEPLNLLSAAANSVTSFQTFNIQSPIEHFIEINNSSLEFFIAPLEP